MKRLGLIAGMSLLASMARAQVPPPPSPPSLQWNAGPVYSTPGGTVVGGVFTIPAAGSDYSASSVTATGSTTARTLAARAGDVANVLDFGADPTNGADSTAAIRAAVATGRTVYLPKGTYKVSDLITLGNGQRMYGDGRTVSQLSANSTTFNLSALGVVQLATSETGAVLDDIGFLFSQPTTTATTTAASTYTTGATTITVANAAGAATGNFVVDTTASTAIPAGTIATITGNSISLSNALTGTVASGDSIGFGPGRSQLVAFPPAIYAQNAARFQIHRVRVSAANICLDARGNSGGAYVDDFECGALTTGMLWDGALDFVHVNNYHFWDFGISGPWLTGVYRDGNTFAAQLGNVDGGTFSNYVSYHGRTSILADATIMTFSNVILDQNATMEIAGGTNLISNLISNGTSPAVCPVTVTGGIVQISNYEMGSWGTDACASGGGSLLTINGGTVINLNPATPAATVGSGSTLEIRGVRVDNVSATWTAPMFQATGTGILAVQGTTFPAISGTAGPAVAIATDNSQNNVTGNNFNGWTFTPPGALGAYAPNSNSLLPVIGTATSSGVSSAAVFLGPNAGAAFPLTASWPVGIGAGALQNLSASKEDTAVGDWSCQYLTTGNYDTCLGQHALGYETTGSLNTAVGNDAERNVVGVSGTTAVGASAGRGGAPSNQVAVGYSALYGNGGSLIFTGTVTTGDTISITMTAGSAAVTNSPKTYTHTTVGGDTLATIAAALATAINTTPLTGQNLNMLAQTDTATGAPVAIQLDFPGTATTGWQIVVTQSVSGAATEVVTVGAGETGGNNVAVGAFALIGKEISTGHDNVAIGNATLPFLTTGGGNIAIGTNAGNQISSASDNTTMGYQAGQKITFGARNTILGYDVGSVTLATGNNNILIGTSSSVDTPSASTSNYLNIGGVLTGDLSAGNLAISGSLTVPTPAAGDSSTKVATTAFAKTKTTLFTYTGSGQTYTPTAGMVSVVVRACGGGGSGGGGALQAASTSASGGASGAGGSCAQRVFWAADIGASQTVTIGAGGTAGAAASTSSHAGGTGASGGNTTFGSLLGVGGGGGGEGGQLAQVSVGGGPGSIGPYQGNTPTGTSNATGRSYCGSIYGSAGGQGVFGSVIGCGSGGSGSSLTGVAFSGQPSADSGPAGGSGGGLTATNGSNSGAAGGPTVDTVSGGVAGSNSSTNGGAGNPSLAPNACYPGSGGGGGYGNASGNATNGGNGGGYAAGGGGGGSAENGSTAGNGGNGSAGCLSVTESF